MPPSNNEGKKKEVIVLRGCGKVAMKLKEVVDGKGPLSPNGSVAKAPGTLEGLCNQGSGTEEFDIRKIWRKAHTDSRKIRGDSGGLDVVGHISDIER